MRLAGLRPERESIADLGPQGGIDAGDRGRACEVEMNQRVRAERFNELDGDRHSLARARRYRKMLRPDAEHRLAAGFAQPRLSLAIQRDRRTVMRKRHAL